MTASRRRNAIGIIGAAVAGPTLALQILSHPLLSRLYGPILYDQAPNPLDASKASTTAGAAVALSANGLFPLFELGLTKVIGEKSCDIAGARFWRASYGEVMGKEGDARNARVGKYKFLNGVKNMSWSPDIETHMRVI